MRIVHRGSGWVLLFLVVVLPRAALAQEVVTISGTVTTHADGLPVRGGVVSIVGADITAATDACGAYVLRVPRSAVRAKQIPMKVEAEGLQTKVTSVAVTAPTVTANVALSLGFHRAGYRWIPCGGAEAEKAVPVDVISRDQIAASGYAETTQLIESMVPSFNAPTTNVLNVAAADAFILRCRASRFRQPAACGRRRQS